MKKLGKVLFVFFFLGLMLPVVVKADYYPMTSSIYSQKTTVGSEVYVVLKGYVIDDNSSSLDGTLTYDTNVFEFVEMRELFFDVIEGEVGSCGSVKITSNKDGKIEYKYILDSGEGCGYVDLEDTRVDVVATFKVKSQPTGGKSKILIDAINEYIPGEDHTVSIDIVGDSNQLKCDTNSETDILTYVPWGISGVLTIALVVIILKKH